MDKQRMGRRAFFAWAGAALAAVGAAGPFASAARAADAIDTGKFKEGCQQGGGSYVENRDGSFQCNLRDGGTIKCPSTTAQCTYTAKLILVVDNAAGLDGGVYGLPANLDLGITPAPEPAPEPRRKRRRRRSRR